MTHVMFLAEQTL